MLPLQTTARHNVPQKRKVAVWSADSFCCVHCGKEMQKGSRELTVDHIITVNFAPANANWLNKTYNLVTSCRSCNSKRKDKPLPDDDLNLKRFYMYKKIDDERASLEEFGAQKSREITYIRTMRKNIATWFERLTNNNYIPFEILGSPFVDDLILFNTAEDIYQALKICVWRKHPNPNYGFSVKETEAIFYNDLPQDLARMKKERGC